MKTFEEYSKSVFEKRDRIIKQRKKRIRAAAAVSVCAVAVVSVSAYALSDSFGKDEFFSSSISNSEISSAESKAAQEIAEEVSFFSDVLSEVKDSASDSCLPDGNSAFDGLGSAAPGEAEITDEYGYLSELTETAVTSFSENNSEATTPVPDIYDITSPLEEYKPENSDDGLKRTYSDEEIIAAAFDVLNADEAKSVDKQSAFVAIEHKSTGEENYIVMFETSDGGFIKVRLNAETLEEVE